MYVGQTRGYRLQPPLARAGSLTVIHISTVESAPRGGQLRFGRSRSRWHGGGGRRLGALEPAALRRGGTGRQAEERAVGQDGGTDPQEPRRDAAGEAARLGGADGPVPPGPG